MERLAFAALDPWRLQPGEPGGARTWRAPGRCRSPAGGGARGGGGCGRGGVLGGRGESFMQSRRCCHCHSHSPRAARSRRERRERASERSEPGPAEGAPGSCLHRRLRRVPGPGEERRRVGESGAEPARPSCRRAPAPLGRLLRRSRGAPADRPAGRRARSAGPRSPPGMV